IAGFAAGYILGTKAGRERYDQISDAVRQFSRNPGVQRFTTEVNKTVNVGKERAKEAASQAVETAGTKARSAVSNVPKKTDQNLDRTTGRNADDPLNAEPISTVVTGPKKALPQQRGPSTHSGRSCTSTGAPISQLGWPTPGSPRYKGGSVVQKAGTPVPGRGGKGE